MHRILINRFKSLVADAACAASLLSAMAAGSSCGAADLEASAFAASARQLSWLDGLTDDASPSDVVPPFGLPRVTSSSGDRVFAGERSVSMAFLETDAADATFGLADPSDVNHVSYLTSSSNSIPGRLSGAKDAIESRVRDVFDGPPSAAIPGSLLPRPLSNPWLSNQPLSPQSGSSVADRIQTRLRGGMTYLNNTHETMTSGNYGLDGAVPLQGNLGLYGAAMGSHFSNGSQFMGTFGTYRTSNPYSDDTLDRIGFSMLTDLFMDSRVDDVWLSRLRLQAGYRIDPATAIGVRLSLPMHSGVGPAIGGPPGATMAYRNVRAVDTYVARYYGSYLTNVSVGYLDRLNTTTFGFNLRSPIVRNRAYLWCGAVYAERTAGWLAVVNLELRLDPPRWGRDACGGGSGCGDDCFLPAWNPSSVWDDPAISNGFNQSPPGFWNQTTGPNAGAMIPPLPI